ncbi:hypothetical protein Asbog_00520 [Asaia bogorensis NBRC 16594]|uniref:Uncharacterized protein n=1 Tax=Asaia bogorensis NBRC 16594 TaxID=1231624 RepID=A0AAN4R2N3_9PROT|nr:hypothetical protein Asbog_00520 [Asaia bogorensis NBRC 16594]GEL53180.1 hypothetical protein ABO01nite_11870 [Asaia bogorensis NBRC 16594]
MLAGVVLPAVVLVGVALDEGAADGVVAAEAGACEVTPEAADDAVAGADAACAGAAGVSCARVAWAVANDRPTSETMNA